MKRFLMYIVVAIVLISTGLSVYYVVRNDEEIYSTVAEDSSFYINVGETLEIPVVRENPASYTEFTVKSGYEQFFDIDLENWTITAKNGGEITISFISTNKRYEGEEFAVNCKMGNGTVKYPYYIRNEQDLLNIGKGRYKLSNSYEVVKDISMTAPMLPIGVTIEDNQVIVSEFSGRIIGGKHTISNAYVKVEGNKTSNSSGFFAILGENAKVENLVFENITVEGYHKYAGTIAGTNYGLIGNCQVKNGKVINTYYNGYTGGIAGLNQRKSGSNNFAQINICLAEVSIDSKWVAGGAVGKNTGGVIYNCLLKTNSIKLNVDAGTDSKYSYFGGVAGVSLCGESGEEVYDSYVANCLVYIDDIESATNVAGIFGAYYGKSKAYEAEGSYKMLMYVVDSDIKTYYLCDDEVEISDKNPNSAYGYAKHITNEEALVEKTYTSPAGSNWDFSSVWSLYEGDTISLGFDKKTEKNPIDYQTFTSNGETFCIKNNKDFKNAVATMRAQPSKNYIYEFKESVKFDGEQMTWDPIGTVEEPFQGQFKVADDVTITIKNIKINSEYAGLFGVIAGNNTIVKNITLQDFEINGTMAGGIAAYNDGATIENCQIKGYSIYTNKYAGSIVGYNAGTVKDCLVCSEQKTDENGNVLEDETGNPVYTSSSLDGGIYSNKNSSESVFYIGGIVGKNTNTGKISNVFLSKVSVRQIAGDNRTLFIGGAAAMNEGTIENVIISNGFAVFGGACSSETIWAGGLVGYHYDGKISSSAVTGEAGETYSSLTFAEINENSVAGGIAGYIAADAKVEASVADLIVINAYSIGGFAGICDGTIVESYVSNNCDLIGAYVGGFTGSLRGTIQDCMTAAKCEAKKIAAGMTVYLRNGSEINTCYIDVSFKEGGKVYAETSSAFRARPDRFGSINNTIIVADEDNDYFTLVGPLTGNTYLSGLSVKISGVKAELQDTFHTLGIGSLPIITNYSSVNCTVGGMLSKYGFSKETWNLDDPDTNAQEMALPTAAAKVMKINIADKHKTTSSGGNGTQQPETPSNDNQQVTTTPTKNEEKTAA